MIKTERLYLKLLSEEDEGHIVKWRNKKEVIDNFFSHKGITLEEHKNWYQSYLKNDSRIEFIIIKKDDDKKIGTIGLSNIDYRNQKCEYGILIGEEEEQRKGYGKEASIAIIDYAFQELNLHKIYLKVFSDNEFALKVYDSLGFKKEGLLKKDIFKNGEFKDVVIMGILRE